MSRIKLDWKWLKLDGEAKVMKTIWPMFLAVYLVVFVVLTGWGVYMLWGVNPDFTQVIALPANPDEKPVSGPPNLSRIVPDSVAGNAAKITIVGAGFAKGTVVKLDDAVRPQTYIDANHITISLTAADLTTESTDVLTLNDGTTDFGTGRIQIVKGQAKEWKINEDTQFLLLVLLMGAFGSCVYGLKSLADYIGVCKFSASWSCYYLVQPFEGAGIALIMYLVIRGGFLTGAADTNSVNKFGICAIAALAGAFSDTAFMKLREVFLALFKPKDDRSGKVDGPKLQITTTSLTSWDSAHSGYDETLKATGGTGSYKWALTDRLPAANPISMPPGLTLDAASGRITGAQGAQNPQLYTLTFSVTDGNDTITKDLKLTVT
jgi:putative Ig domain-containing protein